jgi:hypothetical protein
MGGRAGGEEEGGGVEASRVGRLILLMRTVAEIQAALPKLGNDELRQIEEAVRQLYRQRKAGIIFEDTYGLWTEDDQTSAAAEVFRMFDREEGEHGPT